MEIPKYSFITMVPLAGPIMAERWKLDIAEAMAQVAKQYDHRLSPDAFGGPNFSLYSRLAVCKSKAELAIELLSVSVSLYDSFLYEITSIYREEFRDVPMSIDFTDDADTIAIREILTEFYQIYPEVTVVTMMPLDFDGTFGFVVIPKDMNP